ncbi:N-acetylmuramate alpha-1-phosphate uridylyltransferase MurU [Chitinimonas lacunae]|uniref:N-acetylmuramate alpha-1-phosphate uridylyltransferase MurU n=1 Tax=Chitinimonas lacunae TaxID=1963018 RepID=A0ABV8MSE6_9NEIS
MKVMLLAAGRGERMRPLTDHTPKPLLEVGGEPLIACHLRRLAAAGFREVVINHAWLGQKIEARLGDGRTWGVEITYSREGTGLETAGGIARALPLLGGQPFLVVNGDIWTDYDFAKAHDIAGAMATDPDRLGHLVLVDKPSYPTGADLALLPSGRVTPHGEGLVPLTFSGIAVYSPQFFADIPGDRPGPLLPHFLAAMAAGRLSGEHFGGRWVDVGTVGRLEWARHEAKAEKSRK